MRTCSTSPASTLSLPFWPVAMAGEPSLVMTVSPPALATATPGEPGMNPLPPAPADATDEPPVTNPPPNLADDGVVVAVDDGVAVA